MKSKDPTPCREADHSPEPQAPPPVDQIDSERPDALRPEKADVEVLKNCKDLRSAAPSEGTGVSGTSAKSAPSQSKPQTNQPT